MIEDKILEYVKENPGVGLGKLPKIFQVDKYNRKEFIKMIDGLEKDGKIFIDKHEKIFLVDGVKYVRGKIQGSEKGFGFLISDMARDIYIAKEDMNSAMNKDIVLVKIKKDQKDKKPEGKVLKIIKRGEEKVIGVLQASKDYGFVIPDDPKYSSDIYIPKEEINGAQDGQKVVVKITKWAEKNKSPEGKIKDILGYVGEPGVDILSIAQSFDIPLKFPKKVLNEAKYIPQEISEKSLKDRADFRDHIIYTIDGKDSKDFDDAIEVCKNTDGTYFLGVHIADVSQYVKEASYIDKEAFKRGNSYYLIDKVIPMLPVELSNGICSLNEGVERLTLSCLMTVDQKGKVIKSEIKESVIKSKRRLVYDNVSDYLEKGIKHESLEGLYESLDLGKELAEILMKKREDRGAIDFDFPENEFVLNEEGHPLEVKISERRIGNKLIEEFMILANETVAETYYWMQVPFLYRIHEEPEEEKIDTLNAAIRHLDLKVKVSQELQPIEIQKLIKKVEGSPEELFVSTLALRSLQKARYSEVNDKHFGLASKYYCHFTSPIRRYADLTIHRVIKDIIHGRLSEKRIKSLEALMPLIADKTSMMERVAQSAERKVDAVKMAEYMKDHIGESFEGIISSVTNFGIFVQLQNLIEGLVSYQSMDEYFEYDENEFCAKSTQSNKSYHMGDKVKVKCLGADLIAGTIDFELE